MLRRFGIHFREPDPVPSPEQATRGFVRVPGLYLHIPFCRTICPFCPYNKVPYEAELAADYVRNLEREIAMYLGVLSGPFPSLYVGGGTPTLCIEEMEGLLERLPIAGERAVEVLPTHLTPATARRLTALGFDYVSLGVQSFDRTALRRLRRPGTPAASRAAIETAVGAFRCVDVDLIFDTAYDEPQVLLEDLELCFRHGVDQVSTYPLMRFGFTPFGNGRHDPGREHVLLRTATELAAAHGYERRSVWTFNRPGSPAYTSITRPYYLGLGAGAASFAGAMFFVNHFGLRQYHAALAEGHLPVARIAQLSRPAAAVYRSFWQAYTGAVPIGSGDPLLGHPVSVAMREVSRILGWTSRVGDAVVLTGSGYDRYHDLERWVTYQLIEPLWSEMMREHDPLPAAVLAGGGSS